MQRISSHDLSGSRDERGSFGAGSACGPRGFLWNGSLWLELGEWVIGLYRYGHLYEPGFPVYPLGTLYPVNSEQGRAWFALAPV